MAKFRDKAARLDFSNLPGLGAPGGEGGGTVPPPAETHRPKTAPGAMMAFAADARSELLAENQALRAQAEEAETLRGKVNELAADLSQWDGAKATRQIDPKRISRSRWANRHELSFADAEFQQLKDELANAGGNVQPIKVRPAGRDEQGELYEVVFGHRRHQGCLELGLPVLALVENLSDQGLFVDMDRENRARKSLSPFEQGKMYQRALDEGLFPSNRKLADAVGVDLSALGKALSLAKLPHQVVAAFSSPLEIQFRWAKPLADALDADPSGVVKRAEAIAKLEPRPSGKDVFERLVAQQGEGGGTVPPPPAEPLLLQTGSRRWGSLSVGADGAVSIKLKPGVLAADRQKALAKLLADFLNDSPVQKR